MNVSAVPLCVQVSSPSSTSAPAVDPSPFFRKLRLKSASSWVLVLKDSLGRTKRHAGFGEILRIGWMYPIAIIPTVTAPTVTGFRSPSTLTTDGQPPFRAAFLCPVLVHAYVFCGGPGRETFGSAGFLWWPVCEPCRQARHPRFAANGGSPAITTGGHMATALSGHRPASYPSPPSWRCVHPTQPGGAACL